MEDTDDQLDPFAQEMIRRNEERRRLLNDSSYQLDPLTEGHCKVESTVASNSKPNRFWISSIDETADENLVAPKKKSVETPIQSSLSIKKDLTKETRIVVEEQKPFDQQRQEMKRSSTESPVTQPVAKTPKVVSKKILKMRQMFEEKLSPYVTTTATLYQKEVESRKKEVQMLRRSPPPSPATRTVNDVIAKQEPAEPEKTVKSSEPSESPLKSLTNSDDTGCNQESQEHNPKNNEPQSGNESRLSQESIDGDTAQQTVCEAFKEIDDYSVEHDQELDDNLNCSIDSRISESKLVIDKALNLSPTKNKLYPDLNIEDVEEFDPPAKPPRLFLENQESIPTNTTPMRTISFYRKEKSAQNSQSSTPDVVLLTPKRCPNAESGIDFEERKRKIKELILKLQREVDDANRVAGQATQALNLCLERDEFIGSFERVEAEKLLLFSAEKRIALMNEIQRLKCKLNDLKPETDSTKGALTLRDFRLKVRSDFVVNKMKGNKTHHFVCIVSNGSNLFTTNVVNTDKLADTHDVSETYIEFQFGISLNELMSNFRVNVHIYDLVTRSRELPHELKYHIKKTPKKNKLTVGRKIKSPTVRSPGGPSAVLTSSFKLVGKVVITLSNYHKKRFAIDNFQFESPLEGTFNAVSELKVSHGFYREAFLDVRGSSGSYSMRWVVLRGHHLVIYRSPEDTENKPPLMKIDLKHVVNPTVCPIPGHLRHMVRINTIALITVDPDSRDILAKGGSLPRSSPKKFLMSAESREQCLEWIKELAKALESIRIWSSDSVKPYPNQEFERLFLSLN